MPPTGSTRLLLPLSSHWVKSLKKIAKGQPRSEESTVIQDTLKIGQKYSTVDQGASEWVQRAVRSKRTSERCEQMSERSITNIPILKYPVSLWRAPKARDKEELPFQLKGLLGHRSRLFAPSSFLFFFLLLKPVAKRQWIVSGSFALPHLFLFVLI